MSTSKKFIGKNTKSKEVETLGSLKFTLNKDENNEILEKNTNPMMGYLNEKIKYIEIENTELKKENGFKD